MTSPLTNPMTVPADGFSFMLERLAEDCAPLQYLREFTQNGIEAILATRSKRGTIVWTRSDAFTNVYKAPKLCIIDNGVGMNGDEMVANINRLSASGKRQALDANFGMGAKISAASRNPFGIIYMSWKDGIGRLLHMWRDPSTGAYGIKRHQRELDGAWVDYAPVAPSVKPAEIDQHGTVVVLLGKAADDNTVMPAGKQQRWIQAYLNARFFRFPDGIEVYARGIESYSKTSERSLVRINGQEHLFDMAGRCLARGTVDLDDARVHWMLLNPEAESTGGRFPASKGHTAALYRGEIYHLLMGAPAYKVMRDFEILYAQSEIALYVEPDESLVATNTSRGQLTYLGGELPWEEWGKRFAAKMPEEIRRRLEEVASRASHDGDDDIAIRKRLQQVAQWFKVSRYRPDPTGACLVDPEASAPGGGPQEGERRGAPNPKPHRPCGGGGHDYSSILQEDDGEPAKPVGPLA